MKNYYEVLGVSRDASTETIKSAYRGIARRYHPDMNPGDHIAEEAFKEAVEAYKILGDSTKRTAYDQGAPVINSVEALFTDQRGRRFMEERLPRAPAAPHAGTDVGVISPLPEQGVWLDLALPLEVTKIEKFAVHLPSDPSTVFVGRVSGVGQPGTRGAHNGDLFVFINTRRK